MGIVKRGVESFLLKAINVDRYLPIQLDITNACNLRCAHCYHPHHKNQGAISLEDWKTILLQYRDLIVSMKYRPTVVICGGEPLISPFLKPLLEFITAEFDSAIISILTNGTLVTDKLALELKRFELLRFQVSLDGPDSERHDSIRGRGNFDRAVRGIRILKAHGFEVNVLSVLSRTTAAWMEDFFRLASSENFQSMNFVRLVSEGSGRKLVETDSDRPLLGADLKASYEELLHLMVKYRVKSKIQGPLFELLVPGLGRSGKFWESIVIDYQGFVIASSRSKLRLGHALHDGLAHIFLTNEVYRGLRQGRVEVCGNCELYEVCGGDRNAAFAATGNFLGADPGCWKQDIKQSFKEAL